MGTILVTSLQPGEGKTAFCAGLALLLQRGGLAPALLKALAVSPPGPGAADPDAAFYQRIQGGGPHTVSPVAVAPGHEAQPLSVGAIVQVQAAVQAASHDASPVIVDGPSLTTASGQPSSHAQELAAALDARVVLVVRPQASLTSAAIIEAARAFGPRLAGVLVNSVPQYQRHQLEGAFLSPLHDAGILVVATIPEDRQLLGVSVEDLARHLQGRIILGHEKGGQLVDHLMIGGNVVDWGVHYFSQRSSKAVIVRGDRPDIQMAALHTPTRCLVLTGGHKPLQYVEYEAQEEEVPLVLVQATTLEVATTAETLFDDATIHYPEKIERYAELLAKAVPPGFLASLLE
ncbi:MAG: phosphotransacetylase family protein [Chloroflexi bacterium]|nr:phosphotransacetylase family protein [Chloroflexota bacterium]